MHQRLEMHEICCKTTDSRKTKFSLNGYKMTVLVLSMKWSGRTAERWKSGGMFRVEEYIACIHPMYYSLTCTVYQCRSLSCC